jgi:hypothetical protein
MSKNNSHKISIKKALKLLFKRLSFVLINLNIIIDFDLVFHMVFNNFLFILNCCIQHNYQKSIFNNMVRHSFYNLVYDKINHVHKLD